MELKGGASAAGRGTATAIDHDDPALTGRTYPIPFVRVWVAAVALLRRPGHTLVRDDEDEGILQAECRGSFLPTLHDVTVRVSLDADAQTRVEMESASRSGWFDLGANRRRIRRFMEDLDGAVGTGLRLEDLGGGDSAAPPVQAGAALGSAAAAPSISRSMRSI